MITLSWLIRITSPKKCGQELSSTSHNLYPSSDHVVVFTWDSRGLKKLSKVINGYDYINAKVLDVQEFFKSEEESLEQNFTRSINSYEMTSHQ